MDLPLGRPYYFVTVLHRIVSILVLMDLPLGPCHYRSSTRTWICFNPCFNGSASRTEIQLSTKYIETLSFNPCFNGSASRTRVQDYTGYAGFQVSILVLMDLPLGHADESWTTAWRALCFNPCFNGSASRTSVWPSPGPGSPRFQSLF